MFASGLVFVHIAWQNSVMHASILLNVGRGLESATALQRAQQYQNANIVASSDSDATDYEVEKILAKRTTLDTVEYLVKWRGWDDTFNEWLPEPDLEDSANLLRRFNRRAGNL